MTDANTISCPACGAEIDTREAEPLARVPCAQCGEKVRVTRSFDHFELVETLGAGGMGTVYKARDMRLDRFVALKLLRKELGATPEYARQLQQEAKVTALINHPNVVQVFSVGSDQNQFYLVMELVEKGSLDDLIEEKTRLPEAEVLEAGIQIAKGLRAAYEQGLIHRDVKPANILFARDGTAKITDFGLAGITDPQGQTRREIWGTPYYVAPERLNNAPEDLHSDIYSLGASLFHALAGKPPFEGDTNSATELRALKNNPVRLRDVAPFVSRATASAISRMIEPDPQLRFASYDQLIAALEKAQRRLSDRSAESRKKVALLIVATGMIAAAICGWLLTNGESGGPTSEAFPSPTAKPSLDTEFREARRMLLDGRYGKAGGAFARIATETKNRQPSYDWARLNQALASLLEHDESQMRQALQEVENAGTRDFADVRLGAFFLEMARQATARRAIALSDIPAQPAGPRPFALLFLGLVDVQLGRFTDAAALLEAFRASQPASTDSWVLEYKPIAQKYLDDSRALLGWRGQNRAAASASEVKTALANLRDIIPRLQKQTAIAKEAGLLEKTLARRLGEAEANEKPRHGEKHKDLLARETPIWNAAVENFQRRVATYDFAGAAEAIRGAQVSSMQQQRVGYLQAAAWLKEWKATLINDLNARGYHGLVIVNKTEYSGIAGATADKLRLLTPYGEAQVDWVKVLPASLVAVSNSFANDADRKWRCGVFAWAIGAGSTARRFFDAACAEKPAYREARKFFQQTER